RLTSLVTMVLAIALGAFASPLFAVLGAQTAVPGAEAQHRPGGEANLVIPDLNQAQFFGIAGRTLLMYGLIVCAFGLLFGLMSYSRLKNMPVHQSMREISELIYETCKTYLLTQGRFLLILYVFIGLVIFLYFRILLDFPWTRVGIILLFGLIGMAGSYGVAWF